jgi:hypothetical protein
MLICFALVSLGCSTATHRVSIVAWVGATAISTTTLAHWVPLVAERHPKLPNALAWEPERTETTPQKRALSFLISSSQILEAARQHDVVISDTAARAALTRLYQEEEYGLIAPGSYEAELGSLVSMSHRASDRTWLARVILAAEALDTLLRATAERSVPQAMLERYYELHRRSFLIPERRDVAVIESFDLANALAARRELHAGASLSAVVSLRDAEPNVGGLKSNLLREHLPHPYENTYFTAPLDKVVGPLKSEIYFLFEVTRIQPARQRQFPEVAAAIGRRLLNGSEASILRAIRRDATSAVRRTTTCRAGYVLAQCSGYFPR